MESLVPTGKQIKKSLIDVDMSYTELAKTAGVSVYYIREICAETRKAVKTRARIASILKNAYLKRGMVPPRALENKDNNQKERVA